MSTYFLKRFDNSGRLHGCGELQAPDDNEVIAWAIKLPRSFKYELWCGDRLVYESGPAELRKERAVSFQETRL